MENLRTNTATETITEESWRGNFADFKEDGSDKVTVEIPIFLIFGEFLGYCSRFTKMATEWCEGKVPDLHIQKIMRLEAKTMLRQMKKDYDEKTIRYWFFTYYTPIFKEYEEKLLGLFSEE